jgi:chemotaxis protein MotB
MAEKKKKCPPEGSPDWLLTYGDMTTLLLTFFIMMYTSAKVDGKEMQLILSAFQGSFGLMPGGKTLTAGELAELGNVIESLPATDRGRSMAKAVKEAISLFLAEIKSRKVRVDLNERGIIVSLSSDAYFKKGSADLDIDTARKVLEKLAQLISQDEYRDKSIRIEGHTDSDPTDEDGPWPTNWHLSTARALNVLDYLVDFGADPGRMSVVGYGEYQPIFENDTEEHKSKNRRVDIVILRGK